MSNYKNSSKNPKSGDIVTDESNIQYSVMVVRLIPKGKDRNFVIDDGDIKHLVLDNPENYSLVENGTVI